MGKLELELVAIVACAVCLIVGVAGPKSVADFTNLSLALCLGAWALWTHWTLRFQKCTKCNWGYDWHFLSFLKSGHLFQSSTHHILLSDLRRSVEFRLLGVSVLAAIFFFQPNALAIGPTSFASLLFAMITFGLVLVLRKSAVKGVFCYLSKK